MATPLDQIRSGLPPRCVQLFDRRDGIPQLVRLLREEIDPTETDKGQCRIWDDCARNYTLQGRFHEALSIYYAMYAKLMDMQNRLGERVHKGTPLVRISELHALMGNPLVAKRYLMLTVCEDAMSSKGVIPPETTGSYFRAVWLQGISDEQLQGYASAAWAVSQQESDASRFPEWALQGLDQKWMVEYPSATEASLYVANSAYVRWLFSRFGSGDGRALERLAHYLISCVPGFRPRMRGRTPSTDYDVYSAIEGPTFDFRSDLGRYFLCECKDWKDRVDVTAVRKFASVLQAAKCRFGIIFSRKGLSGRDDAADARRELLKINQEGKVTIVSISEGELNEVASGANFFSILRDLYEQEHLDLPRTNMRKARAGGRKRST